MLPNLYVWAWKIHENRPRPRRRSLPGWSEPRHQVTQTGLKNETALRVSGEFTCRRTPEGQDFDLLASGNHDARTGRIHIREHVADRRRRALVIHVNDVVIAVVAIASLAPHANAVGQIVGGRCGRRRHRRRDDRCSGKNRAAAQVLRRFRRRTTGHTIRPCTARARTSPTPARVPA